MCAGGRRSRTAVQAVVGNRCVRSRPGRITPLPQRLSKAAVGRWSGATAVHGRRQLRHVHGPQRRITGKPHTTLEMPTISHGRWAFSHLVVEMRAHLGGKVGFTPPCRGDDGHLGGKVGFCPTNSGDGASSRCPVGISPPRWGDDGHLGRKVGSRDVLAHTAIPPL